MAGEKEQVVEDGEVAWQMGESARAAARCEQVHQEAVVFGRKCIEAGCAHAAGGQVVTIDGSPLEYNRKAAYLNPHFFVFADTDKDWLRPFQD